MRFYSVYVFAFVKLLAATVYFSGLPKHTSSKSSQQYHLNKTIYFWIQLSSVVSYSE